MPNSQLKNVVIYSNFGVTTTSVNTNFPDGVTSTWYDLMDPTGNTTVSDLMLSIPLQAGQFRIFGNQPSSALSIDDQAFLGFSVYPNPTKTSFSVNLNTSKIEVFDLTGKLVKSFTGSFTRIDSFDISNLKTEIYLVKAQNDSNQTKTTKLVKLK